MFGRKVPDGERGGFTPGERSLLGSIRDFLGFADVMAVLMVFSTTFAAYATWRTATIAQALFMASERPYIGVERVVLDTAHQGDPRVVINYENFGSVAAEDVVLARTIFLDGKQVPGHRLVKHAGIISPGVPHHFHLHIPPIAYRAIMSGKSTLLVRVEASYSAPGRRRLCYLENFIYELDEGQFEVNGGTAKCTARSDFDSTSAKGPSALEPAASAGK